MTLDPEPRPIPELRDSGLLWLINRTAFHPRGLALAFHYGDAGTVTGWSLLDAEDREPWHFDVATDVRGYRAAEQTLAEARTAPRLLACGLCYEEDGEEIHPHPECTIVADRRARLIGYIRDEMERGPSDLIARIADRVITDTGRTACPDRPDNLSADTTTPVVSSADTVWTACPDTRADTGGTPCPDTARTACPDTDDPGWTDCPGVPAAEEIDLGPDGLTDVERTRRTIRDTLRAELTTDDDTAVWELTLAISRALTAMPRHADHASEITHLRARVADLTGTLGEVLDHFTVRATAPGSSRTAFIDDRTTNSWRRMRDGHAAQGWTIAPVQGICPACRRPGLILGHGGRVTCGYGTKCPGPESATTVLENPPSAADECGRPDCTEALRKMVFAHHDARTRYELLRFNINSAAMYMIEYKHQSAYRRARDSRRFLHALRYMLRDPGALTPTEPKATTA